MIEQEIVYIDGSSVVCSGKDATLDHPKIYLKIKPKSGGTICPYCSKRFVQNKE